MRSRRSYPGCTRRRIESTEKTSPETEKRALNRLSSGLEMLRVLHWSRGMAAGGRRGSGGGGGEGSLKEVRRGEGVRLPVLGSTAPDQCLTTRRLRWPRRICHARLTLVHRFLRGHLVFGAFLCVRSSPWRTSGGMVTQIFMDFCSIRYCPHNSRPSGHIRSKISSSYLFAYIMAIFGAVSLGLRKVRDGFETRVRRGLRLNL